MNKKEIKLHLGSGSYYLDGYLNVDYPSDQHSVVSPKADLFMDFRDLDYQDGSVSEIRNHHVFEHYTRAEALKLLLTWRRWLKVGGILRIETPDFDACLTHYLLGNRKTRFEIGRHIFGSQEAPWANHLDFWNKWKFKFILKKLGFKVLKIRKRTNSFAKYFNTPIFNLLGVLIPGKVYKRLGANKLPNIEVIAKKINKDINERKVVRDILSLSLVGKEDDNMLSVWVNDIFK